MNTPDTVVIIGAGDHGRSALEIFREASRYGEQYRVLGFLDDAPARQGGTVADLPVLGGLSWLEEPYRRRLGYVIAIADPHVKQLIAERLRPLALTFASIVHPSAVLATGVRLAPGALINAGVSIAYDTLIAEHTTVNLNATVGHDCYLGRFSTVAPGANIAGRVTLGEGCDIGPNATVGKGLRVGDWSSVGPGAVVIRNVDSRQQVFGNPARVVAPLAAAAGGRAPASHAH